MVRTLYVVAVLCVVMTTMTSLSDAASQCYFCASSIQSNCGNPFNSDGIETCSTHQACETVTLANGTVYRGCISYTVSDPGCTTVDGITNCYCTPQMCNQATSNLYSFTRFVTSLGVIGITALVTLSP